LLIDFFNKNQNINKSHTNDCKVLECEENIIGLCKINYELYIEYRRFLATLICTGVNHGLQLYYNCCSTVKSFQYSLIACRKFR